MASVVPGKTHWTLTPAPAAMALVKAGRLRTLGHSLAKGAVPTASSADELRAYLVKDIEQNRKVIRSADIKSK